MAMPPTNTNTNHNLVDDIIGHTVEMLNATLLLVHNRLAPPPQLSDEKLDQLRDLVEQLSYSSEEFKTGSVRCNIHAEATAMQTSTQEFIDAVEVQLQLQANTNYHIEEEDLLVPQHSNCPLPSDVVGVIATFLEPTLEDQRPLMLVNQTWLRGVACQNLMHVRSGGFRPRRWPFPALRVRDPPLLTLSCGLDRHVADLAREFPRVKGVKLDSVDAITDNAFKHVAKLKLLRRLEIVGYCLYDEDDDHVDVPTNEGFKHLSSLRHLTSLTLVTCNGVSELGLVNFEHLTYLNIERCDQITDDVFDTSGGALKELATLRYVTGKEFTTFATHLRCMKSLADLQLKAPTIGTDVMEAIGDVSGLSSLQLVHCNADEEELNVKEKEAPDCSFLRKLHCLQTLEVSSVYNEDLEDICSGLPSLTTLSIGGRWLTSFYHLPKLRKSLRSLSICGPDYYSPRLDAYDLEHIGTLEHLTSLNLHDCRNIGEGYGISRLTKLTQLEKLTLRRCSIGCSRGNECIPSSENGLKVLQSIAAAFPKLKFVDLKSNHYLEEEAVEGLVQGLKQLRSLRLLRSERISHQFIQLLQQRGLEVDEC